MSKVSKKAVHYFNNGLCCAESVLLSVSESKGIESPLIPKIATGFCGGMSHTNGTCGAIAGGIIAIDMMHGRTKPDDNRDCSEERVQNLVTSFKNKFGSTKCYKLTGCDLGTDEGQEKYNINEVYELCDNLVDFATDKTIELIDKE